MTDATPIWFTIRLPELEELKELLKEEEHLISLDPPGYYKGIARVYCNFDETEK